MPYQAGDEIEIVCLDGALIKACIESWFQFPYKNKNYSFSLGWIIYQDRKCMADILYVTHWENGAGTDEENSELILHFCSSYDYPEIRPQERYRIVTGAKRITCLEQTISQRNVLSER